MERLKSSRARLLERYRHLGENAARRTSDNNLLVQEVMEAEWQALKSSNAPLPSLRKPDAFPQASEDSELAVLEEIQQELILQEQLVLEEYHQSLRFDEECLNAMLEDLEMGHRIICPVCRRDGLCVKSHLVACPCGVRIATQEMTEEKLRSLLEDAMTEHSQHCHYSPEFAVTKGMERDANLLMSCRACDSWAIVL
ncbi:RPA-interacting protein [Sceloporus undulatus]|uniref:RPA-interacting protein n=1 Tax=Sceloporus undulatus TaxID=8520 RepID=UPI001C4D4621|nr:RPA-interacting protein [Sceloporus undulatus]